MHQTLKKIRLWNWAQYFAVKINTFLSFFLKLVNYKVPDASFSVLGNIFHSHIVLRVLKEIAKTHYNLINVFPVELRKKENLLS